MKFEIFYKLLLVVKVVAICFTANADFFLTVEDAFKKSRQFQCEKSLSVNFFGDVYVEEKKINENFDIFQNVKSLLDVAQANVINLEGAVTPHGEREFPTQQFSLKNAIWLPKKLKQSRISYVTLANNHIMDFGKIGLMDTINTLKANGIHHCGAGLNLIQALEPMIINISGLKVSVLSFATTIPSGSWATENRPGIAYPTYAALQKAINKSVKKYDFTVASFHWGKEGSPYLRSHQRTLAHLAIDAGASLVVGHHAHLAQPIEIYKNVPIFFGLGNFTFTSLTSTPVLSLGLHTLFCKSITTGQKKLDWAISPLNTLNGLTHYQTRVHQPKEFFQLATRYVEEGLWPAPMPIVLGVPIPLTPLGKIWHSPLAALK